MLPQRTTTQRFILVAECTCVCIDHPAAFSGNLAALGVLCSHLNVNYLAFQKCTPLHVAVLRRHVDVDSLCFSVLLKIQGGQTLACSWR
jgi:hypothetical protein